MTIDLIEVRHCFRDKANAALWATRGDDGCCADLEGFRHSVVAKELEDMSSVIRQVAAGAVAE